MEPFTFLSRKLSSFMYTGKIHSSIDIENVFEKLVLDEIILGMKYNNKYKGDIKHTSCFFNQISFNVYLPQFQKKMNLKVFNTGSFQISGATSEDQVNILLPLIISRLSKIKGEETIQIIKKDGFLLDLQDYMVCTNKKKERFKNIKIYNTSGKVVGYKNGSYLQFGNTEIVKDKEFNVLQDIVRNSFVKNVYNKNGENIGDITYELVSNKNLKRIQINKRLVIEKISDTEVHYYKVYKAKNKEIIKDLYFKKVLNIKEPVETEETEEIEDFLTVRYSALMTDINLTDYSTKLSNMNDIFYFTKDSEYYLNIDNFVRYCEENNGLKVYKNNTSIKLNVLTIKLYVDQDFNIVDKKDSTEHFSILYYTLYNKIIISSLQNYDHVEKVENLLLKIINSGKSEVFEKTKKFKEKIEKIEKIELSSLI